MNKAATIERKTGPRDLETIAASLAEVKKTLKQLQLERERAGKYRRPRRKILQEVKAALSLR